MTWDSRIVTGREMIPLPPIPTFDISYHAEVVVGDGIVRVFADSRTQFEERLQQIFAMFHGDARQMTFLYADGRRTIYTLTTGEHGKLWTAVVQNAA